MQLWGVLLLLVSLQSAGQSPSGSVVLSTSRNHPYVGEVIELKLTIHSPPGSIPLNLVIPGLTADEVWRFLFDSWLHQGTTPPANALPLKWHGRVLYVSPVRPGEYELRWKALVGAPGDDNNPTRRIGPVQVGMMTSNPLTLEIERPPLQSPSPNTWDLGVGNYRVSAQWLPAEVVLGEETLLSITVDGAGAKENITPPPLRTLPGWESDRFLLEALPAGWKNGNRLFRYLVRPRQLRATVPPLFIRFFDPERSASVTQTITLPPLSILAAKDVRNMAPGSMIADALSHLPEFRGKSIEQHVPDHWSTWLNLLLWLPVVWSGIVVGRMALERFAPGWLQERRWEQAERLARTRFKQSESFPTQHVRSILAAYLSNGLARPIDEDWESLSIHAPLAPRPIQPILTHLQELEFGPGDEQAASQLHSAVKEVFQLQETAS
ncbi:MAG TPA: hypothetical protein PLN21_08305 [Gemmatales bacterium]|nr:hypothetical protein [Gemmatales bacterium]